MASAPERKPSAYAGAPVVLALTIFNVVVFAAMIAWERSASAVMTPATRTTLAFGANYASATIHEWRIETLLTSCFVHFGALHLAFNMTAMNQVGPFLERSIGSGRVALLYVVSGIWGSITSAVWSRAALHASASFPALHLEPIQALNRLSAGASGAICGFIGAAAILGVRAQGIRGPLARGMAKWLGIVVLFGLALGADNAAHLGGAAAGAVSAAMWERKPEGAARARALVALGALLVLGAFARSAYVAATQPYALMTIRERLLLADALAGEGKCAAASNAFEAGRRLVPELRDLALEPRPCP